MKKTINNFRTQPLEDPQNKIETIKHAESKSISLHHHLSLIRLTNFKAYNWH